MTDWPLAVHLAQPHAARRRRHQVRAHAEIAVLELLELPGHDRAERIDRRDLDGGRAARRRPTAAAGTASTETPDARSATSSLLRLSRQNEYMAPNSTAKGSVFCAVSGSL